MARRFKFRLETVRKIRERERDAHRRVVATKVREVAVIRERVGTLAEGMEDNRCAGRITRRVGRVPIELLRGQAYYQTWLTRANETTHEELENGLNELRAEQDKLGVFSKRLKVIEKLRERQWKIHQTGVAREESAANDEAAHQLFLRKRYGAIA